MNQSTVWEKSDRVGGDLLLLAFGSAKTVFVSDLSGKEIEEGKGARIRITFDDARSGSYEIDATADEARELGQEGRQVARRGRKPKGVS